MMASENDKEAQKRRNIWEKEILKAKKIIFIPKNEKTKEKTHKLKLIYIENIDWEI